LANTDSWGLYPDREMWSVPLPQAEDDDVTLLNNYIGNHVISRRKQLLKWHTRQLCAVFPDCAAEEVCVIPLPADKRCYEVYHWGAGSPRAALQWLDWLCIFGSFPKNILQSPLAFSHSCCRAIQGTKCTGLLSFNDVFLFLKSTGKFSLQIPT